MFRRDPQVDSNFSRFLMKKYSSVPQDNEERIMIGIRELMKKGRNSREPIKNFLNEAANLILRRFEFKEVAIGLLNRADKKYRYVVTIGYATQAQIAQTQKVYSFNDFFDNENYPAINIGDGTEFLTETPREEDREIYSKPSLLGKERESMENMIEGDYFDINMYGDNNELIGWIELSSPRSGKIPSRDALK